MRTTPVLRNTHPYSGLYVTDDKRIGHSTVLNLVLPVLGMLPQNTLPHVNILHEIKEHK